MSTFPADVPSASDPEPETDAEDCHNRQPADIASALTRFSNTRGCQIFIEDMAPYDAYYPKNRKD